MGWKFIESKKSWFSTNPNTVEYLYVFVYQNSPKLAPFFFLRKGARFPFDMALLQSPKMVEGSIHRWKVVLPKTCHQETVNVIKNSFTVPLIWNAQCKLLWPAIVDEIAAPLVNHFTNYRESLIKKSCGCPMIDGYDILWWFPPLRMQSSLAGWQITCSGSKNLRNTFKNSLQKPGPKDKPKVYPYVYTCIYIYIYTWTFPFV